MYATADDVYAITGYTVDPSMIKMAQTIIEIYTGRVEADIVGGRDRSLLGRATAFQAAYMNDSTDMIFEQVAGATVGQNDSLVQFRAGDNHSPFVSPLAALACKHLSWKKSRSIHTGRIFDRGRSYVPRDTGEAREVAGSVSQTPVDEGFGLGWVTE